jgi:hypothetical protein
MKKTNDYFNAQMFECCLTMIKILLEKYQNSIISEDQLIEHSRKKIDFILSELNNTSINEDLKNEANNILKEYNKVSSYKISISDHPAFY